MNIRSLALAFLVSLTACSTINPPEVPVPSGYVFSPSTPKDLSSLKHTDAIVQGKIVKIEPDWLYDDPCGVIATALKRCGGTRAYHVDVETLHGKATFMIFVPHDDFEPLPLGLDATFLLSKLWVVPFQKCKFAAAVAGGSACSTMGEMSYVLTDVQNVWPKGFLVDIAN